jgi:hypothetical protein
VDKERIRLKEKGGQREDEKERRRLKEKGGRREDKIERKGWTKRE